MNQKELKELIDFLIEKDISEFELERGDVKVRIKRGSDQATVITHAMPVAPMPMAASPVQTQSQSHTPAPGSLPFVKAGDQVAAGQVVCIIEAMKLMNEIESDASGEIVKILVNNGQPVEYGQPLFSIRPRK